MKILVVNCGSSSIKYKLYDMQTEAALASGGVERVGQEGIDESNMPFIKIKLPDGGDKKIFAKIPTHTEGMQLVFDALLNPEYGAIKSLDEIDAAGHRIVHGGLFTKSLVVTEEILEEWKQYAELAPLHSYAHLKGYEGVKKVLPNLPQVFVFDTAFHQTMPEHAFRYAIPENIYRELHVRRYGFHGTSHRYVTGRAAEFLGYGSLEGKRIVSCHIGNGASVAAIKDGKVVDTSMGLTPLEGLMMGTRTGDIDSSAILYIMEKRGLDLKQANDLLNKQSGMIGVSEISSDMRDIEQAVREGNERAIVAQHMYTYRIKKYIGSYAAAMGGLDAIIFTAGVGEHQWDIRSGAVEGLEFLGIEIDTEKNKKNHGAEEILSTPNSRVTIAVIPTDEEKLIARDTLELIK